MKNVYTQKLIFMHEQNKKKNKNNSEKKHADTCK